MRFHYGPYAARLDVDRAVTVPLCRHVDDGPGGDDLPTLRVERGDVPEGEGLRAALPGWAALVTEQHVLVRIHDHAREDYAFYNQLFAALGLARVILDGGLVLHASSIAVEGRAYLFAGLSGAGKSTVSRRVGAGRRIADDQSMLLPTPEGWWCRNAFPEDEAVGLSPPSLPHPPGNTLGGAAAGHRPGTSPGHAPPRALGCRRRCPRPGARKPQPLPRRGPLLRAGRRAG